MNVYKLAIILFLFISLPIYPQNEQEQYTNTEIDPKIDLSQKEINLTQEKVNGFRRELDNYKESYVRQEERIRDVFIFINIYLIIVSIVIAIVGIFGYRKVKRDTQKEVQEKSDEIKRLGKEAEATAKEIQKLIDEAKENIQKLIDETEKNLDDHSTSVMKKQKEKANEFAKIIKDLLQKLNIQSEDSGETGGEGETNAKTRFIKPKTNKDANPKANNK